MTTAGIGSGVITFDYIERRFRDVIRDLGKLAKKFEEHEQAHVDELRAELEAALAAPRSRRLEWCAVAGAFGSVASIIVAVVALAQH